MLLRVRYLPCWIPRWILLRNMSRTFHAADKNSGHSRSHQELNPSTKASFRMTSSPMNTSSAQNYHCVFRKWINNRECKECRHQRDKRRANHYHCCFFCTSYGHQARPLSFRAHPITKQGNSCSISTPFTVVKEAENFQFSLQFVPVTPPSSS